MANDEMEKSGPEFIEFRHIDLVWIAATLREAGNRCMIP